MHELWLCKSILEIIKQNAIEKNCTRITKIVLEIGHHKHEHDHHSHDEHLIHIEQNILAKNQQVAL